MSARIQAAVAESPADVAECQRVRHRVFVLEKRILRHDVPEIDREVDEYDGLETTVHILARADGEAVATLRLLRPSPAVMGPSGLGLAARYDLTPLAVPGVSVAEGSRMCVVPERRGGPVFGALCAAMIHEGLRLGLVSDRFRLVPRRGASAPRPSIRRIYTAEERARARAGDLDGLQLPRALRTFATHLAARYAGPPIRERDYTVCSLPAVIDLAAAARAQALRRAPP